MKTNTEPSGEDPSNLLPTPSAFIEMMGGDPGICLKIVSTALLELEGLEQAALEASAAGNGVNLARILHSLRGSSGTLGADQFAQQLNAWENDFDGGGKMIPEDWPKDDFQGWCQRYRLDLQHLQNAIIDLR